MAIKLVDELQAMGNFPIAHAEGINLVKEDGTEDNLQNLFNNGELGGGGDNSVTLTQEEYEALPEEERLNGLYYTYDTKRIYKNGVQYGASEPIPLTMEEYKALKEAGAIDEKQDYIVEASAEGILLGAEDIGYNNAVSGIQVNTVQGAIDKVAEKADGLILDTDLTSTTSTLSASKIRSAVVHSFNTQDGKVKYLKLKLDVNPISVVDIYGGKIEILGANNSSANPDYKTVKVVRHSYGDWTSYDATQVPSVLSTKIGSLYYYPTDNYYYLQLNNYAHFIVTGALTKPEMVASLPVETSAMTLIPESAFATKKDIDGTTIQTTTITGSEYYAITYGDDYNDPANQNILIQYKRSNFPPSTYIFSAVSYATDTRETVSVAKISNNFAGTTYDLRFYIDKDNKTMYLKMPSYSSVSLQNLAFKSKAVTYTKVDSIPSTATTLAVAEYAVKNEVPTTHSLTLKTGYAGYITEIYDPTTKVVVYNVNVNGTFKGLGNAIATGFKVPKDAVSGDDVIVSTIGIYGAVNATTGDAQFTRLLIRSYENPFFDVDAQGNYEISGTITYVTV